MDNEDLHNDDKSNVIPDKGNTFVGADGRTYRLLGASGLVEDEDGEIYNASDLSDPYSQAKQKTTNPSLFTPSKSDEPDWFAIYDPRYCGPSREEYMDKMHRQYMAQKASQLQAQSDNTTHNSYDVSKSSSNNEPFNPPTIHPKATEHSSPVFPTHFGTSKPSVQSSQEQKPLSNDEQKPTADRPEPIVEKQVKLHFSKRTIVFYIVGAIFLLAYFILLIIKLTSLIIQLFSI